MVAKREPPETRRPVSFRFQPETVEAIGRAADEAGRTRSAWVEHQLRVAAGLDEGPNTLLGVPSEPQVVLVGALPPGVLRCPCGCHRAIDRHPDRACACLDPNALLRAKRERIRKLQQGET